MLKLLKKEQRDKSSSHMPVLKQETTDLIKLTKRKVNPCPAEPG